MNNTAPAKSPVLPPPAGPGEPQDNLATGLARALALFSSPEDLRHNSRLLAAVLDSITDGVVVANLQGELVLFNRAAEDILGLGWTHTPMAEWSNVYGCFLPDAVTLYPPHELPLARAVRGEEVREAEVFIRNVRKPRGVWVRVNATPLRDEQGRTCGGVVAFRDSTARKRAEQRLAAQYAVSRVLTQTERFEDAARCICDLLCQTLHWQFGAIFLPDESGRTLSCSYRYHAHLPGLEEFAAATEQLAFRRDEGMVGLAWTAQQPLLVHDLAKEPTCVRAAAARDAGLQGGLLFPVHLGGELVAVFEFYHLFPGSGTDELVGLASHVQTLLVQFLRRRRAEEELRQLTLDLVRSNTDLEQFAYLASHDLQEPLRMVASYCRLLQQRYQQRLDDTGREFLGYALDGAERMQQMIHGLLTYARVSTQPHTLETTDTLTVLERALHHLRLRLQETGGRVCIGALPVIEADSGQLLLLLQNLLANALKFHGDQPPRIHVWAEPLVDQVTRCPGNQVTESGSGHLVNQGGWIFHVRDEGIGIPVEAQERLFRAFERLHSPERYPGVGMGLAIARKIVARHGGEIWVESRPGEGADFCFTWPAVTR